MSIDRLIGPQEWHKKSVGFGDLMKSEIPNLDKKSDIDNSIEQNIKENGSLTAQELAFLQGKMKNAEGAYKETFLNTLDQKFQISQKLSFFAGKSENLWTVYSNFKNTFGLNTGEKETESLVMMKMYWNLKNPNNKISPVDGTRSQGLYNKLKVQTAMPNTNNMGVWTSVGGNTISTNSGENKPGIPIETVEQTDLNSVFEIKVD